jgi:PKD repeat protein
MPIKHICRISASVAAALGALIFMLMLLSAQADGPVIDTQASSDAVSTVFGETAEAKTGHSVAIGDINGDGYEDLIVGAPYGDLMPSAVSEYCTSQGYNEYVDCVSGGVYVYLGRPEISQTLDLANGPANVTIYATPNYYSGEQLGRSVAVGDLNGDGLDDIVMGASHYGSSPIGAAFVWVGRDSITTTSSISVNIMNKATPITNGHTIKAVSAWVQDYGGWDVAAGDVNGDGIDDLILGSYNASVDPITSTEYWPPDQQRYHFSSPTADRSSNGTVYVALGDSGFSSSAGVYKDFMKCLPELTIYGEDSGDRLGRSLASGDVDGDGYADIIVGADGGDPGETATDAGEVYVFYGSSVITHAVCQPDFEPYEFKNQLVKEMAYVTTTADITITGVTPGDRSGFDVNVGDLNGDSYDDIIIGAPFADSNRGHVYVVYGGPRATISPTIPLDQAGLLVSGPTADTWLGTSVFAGDLNHDGIDDLLMGAIGIDPDDADYSGSPTTTQKGTTYALFGHTDLSGTVDLSTGNPADVTVLGTSADDWLGRGLAVGDLNGDSFNELLVGAAGLDRTPTLTDTGAAYLIDLAYPQQITVTGSLAEVAIGDAVTFSTSARTWIGARDVTTQTAFSISPAAGGVWDDNVYTATQAGEWTVTGTIDSLVDTTSLSVVPGSLSVTVSPTTAHVLPGDTVEFQATGFDGLGDPIKHLSFDWTIVNGGGTIVDSGPDTVTVQATAADATYADTLIATTSGISGAASIVVSNTAPMASFTCGDCTTPEGTPLSFDATASSDPNNDPLSFSWTFGDSGTGSGPTPAYTYLDNASYLVTLTVEDDDGLTGTQHSLVTVTNAPPAPIITAPDTANRDEPVAFTANANDPGADTFEYRWDWGDESPVVITTTAVVSHTFSTEQVYTVTLRVTDDDGGIGETSHAIDVGPVYRYAYLPFVVRSP